MTTTHALLLFSAFLFFLIGPYLLKALWDATKWAASCWADLVRGRLS